MTKIPARRSFVTGAGAAIASASLGGCALFRRRHPPAPPPPPMHYVVGGPYQAGGVWRYPRAAFDYAETGLATRIGTHAAFMTDGAAWDPDALLGAHPTLQLPCVARVTNLQTGLSLLVRLDDRGPVSPARVLALSPRAWTLLGPGSDPGVLRVALTVETAPSLALANRLAPDADRVSVAAAPTEAVTQQALPPPPGIAARPDRGTQAAGAVPQAASSSTATPALVPLRLPEQLTRYPVGPALLFVDLGGFTRPRYARVLAARMAFLGAVASAAPGGPRDLAYRVRIGPLADADEADATLDRTLAAGVSGARIVVDED